MTPPAGPHGIVLADKPAGWTSHDAVGRARRLLGTKKVGHAGTLDPMATGLLVLGAGQGTRLLTYLVGLDKTYTATIRLGRATTTDDAEGEPLGEPTDASALDGARIDEALAGLRGPIQQVPSSVSAIKVDGQRAYARVRSGQEVELAARPVTIRRLEVLDRRVEGIAVDLDVVVECTSGTYIRALARDLGAQLGVGGHLTALRRTRVGPFAVEDAADIPPRGQDESSLQVRGLGRAAGAVLPTVELDDAQAIDLGHGKRVRPLRTPEALGAPLAVLDAEGRLLGIAVAEDDGDLRPVLVVPPEARS